MASPFQVSIFDPTTGQINIVTSNNNKTVTIYDTSNYIGNNTPGCGLSLFLNFRIFTLQYFQGSVFTNSSITVPPGCTPAASNVQNTTININTGDGWYLVTLYSVPTWEPSGISYTQAQSQVYNPTDGNIYTCSASNTSSSANRPDLSPNIWTLVPNTTYSTGILPQFQSSGYFAIMSNTLTCLPQLISNALCSNPNFPCNHITLANNTNFLNAIQVMMLVYAAQNANSLNLLSQTTNIFDLMGTICGCETPQ